MLTRPPCHAEIEHGQVREFQLDFLQPAPATAPATPGSLHHGSPRGAGQATEMDAVAAFQALKHKNVINTQQISSAPTANGQKQLWPATNGLNGQ